MEDRVLLCVCVRPCSPVTRKEIDSSEGKPFLGTGQPSLEY